MAPTASSSPARPGRARRSPTTNGSSSSGVAVDALGGRATVVAGTGTYSTAHSVQLTKEAHEIGVDGLLVVTPYYNKPPQRGIVEHFKAIAGVSDKPIVVYNIPARVVINIEPETISELANLPSVKAVKQANDDLAQARHIVEETGLDLYAGDDNLIYLVPRARRHRRSLRAHARRRAAGEGDGPRLPARATPTPRRGSTRSFAPPTSC